MRNIKSSFYNVIAPVVEENEYLLYNLVYGGLEVLNWNQGLLVESLQNENYIDLETLSEENSSVVLYLYEKGFFIDMERDEKKEYHDHYKEKRDRLYDRDQANINLTIGTTIVCNMGCPYCFEFVKPNKSLNDDDNLKALIYYLTDMISKSPVKKWNSLNITWYGGEPLINRKAISKLTPMLRELSKAYDMNYNANIITNGILLTVDNWTLLKECGVQNVQITIDGPQKKHDKSRPLKGLNKNRPNYFQILDNLRNIPQEIKVTVRINTDREVADSIDELLQDFRVYGLWPNLYNQITFKPAWLRTYEEANEADVSMRFTVSQFFEFQQSFRLKQVNLYNKWAAENGLKQGKLNWVLPERQDECATWVSPYSLVIDPDGNIHKCWETIHESEEAISHVSQGYDLEKHRKFMEYDRVELNDICANCKYMPVCEKLSCSHQAIKDGKPDCTWWKTETEYSLQSQYRLMKHQPEIIVLPNHLTNENTGHSNK